MATRRRDERTVRPSILDRLVDDDPRSAGDASLSRAETERLYRLSVLRDVEWLLNTRRTIYTAGDEHSELRESVYHYGVPDVTSLGADSTESRHFLLRQVEEALRIFEPRLDDVRVGFSDAEEGAAVKGSRSLSLRVEAVLLMDPDPERIVFDTVLETASGAFVVKE